MSENVPNAALMKGLFIHSDPITHPATKYSCNLKTRDHLKKGKEGPEPDIKTLGTINCQKPHMKGMHFRWVCAGEWELP
jgi:hypothetical protein